MNVEFLTPEPALKMIEGGEWRLHEPMVVKIDGNTVVVPVGFQTDLATVPRFPGLFLIFGGKARRAAILHDYLYFTAQDRAYADRVFYEAMKHEEPAWRRAIMWLGVRAGGWVLYPWAKVSER